MGKLGNFSRNLTTLALLSQIACVPPRTPSLYEMQHVFDAPLAVDGDAFAKKLKEQKLSRPESTSVDSLHKPQVQSNNSPLRTVSTGPYIIGTPIKQTFPFANLDSLSDHLAFPIRRVRTGREDALYQIRILDIPDETYVFFRMCGGRLDRTAYAVSKESLGFFYIAPEGIITEMSKVLDPRKACDRSPRA